MLLGLEFAVGLFWLFLDEFSIGVNSGVLFDHSDFLYHFHIGIQWGLQSISWIFEAILQYFRQVGFVFFVHIKTLEIRLFLFLDLFMSLLLDFAFAFGLFGMIIIFFGRKLFFWDFIGPGIGQVLVGRSGGIFTVLFAFGVRIKRGVFGFEEEIFVALILAD